MSSYSLQACFLSAWKLSYKKLLTFTLGTFSLWFVFVIVPGRKSTHLHKDSIQFSVHIKALKNPTTTMIHWVAFAAKNSNMFSQTNSLWLVRQCTQPLSAAFKRSNTHSEINITSLAQLVEHSSTNREVASSILAWSKKLLTFTLGIFSLWFVFVIVPGQTHLHKDRI